MGASDAGIRGALTQRRREAETRGGLGGWGFFSGGCNGWDVHLLGAGRMVLEIPNQVGNDTFCGSFGFGRGSWKLRDREGGGFVGMDSGFELRFHAFRDADDSHFFCVDEGAALGGGASDFIAYEEFGGEMEGGFVEGLHPHAGGDVLVCEDDSLFVVDTGVDDDGGDVFCGHFFEGVIVVEEFEPEVFEPAYVYGVVDVADEVDVICFDADFEFGEEGPCFSHR